MPSEDDDYSGALNLIHVVLLSPFEYWNDT